jgi:hypothetical protein
MGIVATRCRAVDGHKKEEQRERDGEWSATDVDEATQD